MKWNNAKEILPIETLGTPLLIKFEDYQPELYVVSVGNPNPNPNPNLMYPRDKYLYRHTNINNREQVEGFLYLLSKQILGADNHYYWRYVSKNEMMVFL